jgi:hypothetical protein
MKMKKILVSFFATVFVALFAFAPSGYATPLYEDDVPSYCHEMAVLQHVDFIEVDNAPVVFVAQVHVYATPSEYVSKCAKDAKYRNKDELSTATLPNLPTSELFCKTTPSNWQSKYSNRNYRQNIESAHENYAYPHYNLL